MPTIAPLKNGWRVDENKGFVADQIKSRVDSEDWYTHCKGYPLIKKVTKVKHENN
jgi:hypothetical protein